MALVPHTVNGKIQFYESKLPTWSASAVAIGSSAPEIAALQAKTEAARAALIEQEEAQDTARTKTAALRDAVNAMLDAGSDIIIKIRAKAATDGDGIYQLANIPAPAIPQPKQPPAKPTEMVVTLDESGTLNLKWKCPNPPGTSGTLYQIWRRVSPTAPFTYLGGTGAKFYVDQTLPAGSSQVTYQLQAVRSTATGPWAQFNVNFGVNPNGQMTASVTEGTPVQLAA